MTAAYHTIVAGNRDLTISPYRSVLDTYPDDDTRSSPSTSGCPTPTIRAMPYAGPPARTA